jgi:hypothetical protein
MKQYKNMMDHTGWKHMNNFTLIDEGSFTQEELEMMALNQTFLLGNEQNIQIILDIINNKLQMSCRLLDRFVTKYPRENKDYEDKLMTYSKIYFDPFRRLRKVDYSFGNINFVSSIGQLNFFRWAIQNGIIDYVVAHREAIINSMKQNYN